jgi:hypothetical protein
MYIAWDFPDRPPLGRKFQATSLNAERCPVIVALPPFIEFAKTLQIV